MAIRLKMVRPERFELPTTKFVAWYSIQLSYGRTLETICLGRTAEAMTAEARSGIIQILRPGVNTFRKKNFIASMIDDLAATTTTHAAHPFGRLFVSVLPRPTAAPCGDSRTALDQLWTAGFPSLAEPASSRGGSGGTEPPGPLLDQSAGGPG